MRAWWSLCSGVTQGSILWKALNGETVPAWMIYLAFVALSMWMLARTSRVN